MSELEVHRPSIAGLQGRYRELGRLRMGEKVPTGREKNGRPVTRPVKLDVWRFTSTDWRLIQKAADLYGGEPSRWDDAPGSVRQYQVTSEANDVPVMLPPEVALSQAMEAWKAAECRRRCDGQWEQISGAECLCQDEETPACKPTTRLSVLLTDMPGLGVWRLESHGWYAARELVPMVRMAATFGAGTRFRLRIDPRQRQTKDAAGKTVTYLFGVPVLDTDLTPGQLLATVPAPGPVAEIAASIRESGAGSSAPSVVTGDGATGSPASDNQKSEGGVDADARSVTLARKATPASAEGSSTSPSDHQSDPPRSAPPAVGGSDQTSGAEVRPERSSLAPQGRVGASAPDQTSGGGGRAVRGGAPPPDSTSPGAVRGRQHSGASSSGGDPVDHVRRAVDPPPDPTFSEPAGEGDAIQPDDETVGPADRGEPDTGTARDGTTGAGPSPVQQWCEAHGQDIRVARAYLRRSHPDVFPDLRDRRDLEELRPPRSDEAIAYLDAWYHQATELS